MKSFLPLALVWLSFSLLLLLSDIWSTNKLAGPGRIDLYDSEGLCEGQDLDYMLNGNPRWPIGAAVEFKAKLGDMSGSFAEELTALAALPGYAGNNPVHLRKGNEPERDSLIIERKAAYDLFGSEDIIGGYVYLDGQLMQISGIFRYNAILSQFSSELPQLIASLEYPLFRDKRITQFQLYSPADTDINELNRYFPIDRKKSLKLDLRHKLLLQMIHLLSLPVGLCILYYLFKDVWKELQYRRDLYKVNIKSYYLKESLVRTIKPEAWKYAVPVLLISSVLVVLSFDFYLPADMIGNLTFKKVLSSPLLFLVNRSLSINPLKLLPDLIELMAFIVVCLLYLPGIILLCRIKVTSLKQILYLPLLNVLFAVVCLFFKASPVFDWKSNMLLLGLMLIKFREQGAVVNSKS